MVYTLREHKGQPMLPYPAKLSTNIDGETKVFQDKTKFTFSSSSIGGPVLHPKDDCEDPLLYLPGTGIAS
jgi:hypothetical protein